MTDEETLQENIRKLAESYNKFEKLIKEPGFKEDRCKAKTLDWLCELYEPPILWDHVKSILTPLQISGVIYGIGKTYKVANDIDKSEIRAEVKNRDEKHELFTCIDQLEASIPRFILWNHAKPLLRANQIGRLALTMIGEEIRIANDKLEDLYASSEVDIDRAD